MISSMTMLKEQKLIFQNAALSNFCNFKTEPESFSIVYNFAKKISEETKIKLVDLVTINRFKIK